MDIEAIAVPRGAGLLWIRVGTVLDAALGAMPDHIVDRIVKVSAGFQVATRHRQTGAVKLYEVPDYAVSRVLWQQPDEMSSPPGQNHSFHI